jgi:DNA-binding Xre family transcriptional regulator
MKRRVEYSWHLREIMAARGLNNISDLLPLLTDRGIELSASQIYRLVGQKPERISLALLGAIADALECSIDDLCDFKVVAAASKKAVGTTREPIDLAAVGRPRRARIHRPE